MRQGKAELRPVRLSGLPADMDSPQLAAMPTNLREDFLPVSFPGWKEALGRAALAPEVRERYRRAILSLLKRCKDRRAPVSVALIREHLAASNDPGAREALRWFYKSARGAGRVAGAAEAEPGAERPATAGDAALLHAGAGTRPPAPRVRRGDVPPAASADRGGADWERDLIAAARERGFLWRTEETYRMWGERFAKFLAPRSPYAADAAHVAAFLTALAVEQRASPSTQKQALNALVFLMQEALHRQLGEIRFRRAAPQVRMPVVLGRAECARLFAELEGTVRLMAELMYGSGLRLMELLRLRVQHVDFEQGQIRVSGGKGDRVNGFANAAITSQGLGDALRLCAAI